MPTGIILEPFGGDTVNQPVVVKVGYSTTTDFSMTCRVNTADELPPQLHPAGSSPGTHTSSGISPGAGTWTVFANDTTTPMPATLDQQPGVIVQGVGGALPVIIGPGSGMFGRKGGKRHQKPITGETVAAAKYVVCLIYEIDSAAMTRTIIAAGAAMVKHTGNKYKWSVPVKFKTKKPDNFQYVARVTAYDANSASLGTQTKQIKK